MCPLKKEGSKCILHVFVICDSGFVVCAVVSVNFNALFQVYSLEKDTEKGKSAVNMCLHTLRMMAKGGMHDHIAQVVN